MADVKILAPIILSFEGGYQCFPEDRGNYNSNGVLVGTNMGIAALTYETATGNVPTVDDMRNISKELFTEILKKYFWDRWMGDQINNQSVAEILVDWAWASGHWGITIPQRILGVTADGIVGTKTITALNATDQHNFFDQVKSARFTFINNLVTMDLSQQKFEKGWNERVNSYTFQQ
jgi:lysozyme family protein